MPAAAREDLSRRRNAAALKASREDIRHRAEKLAKFHSRITGCRVAVELTGRHMGNGGQFVVRINLKVPGTLIVVNHDHDEDPHVALRDAFDAAARKLDEVFASL